MSAKSMVRSGIVNFAVFRNATAQGPLGAVPFEYLVIGGGGGSGRQGTTLVGGGGGAGGYRSSVAGELTGGNNTAETNFLSLSGALQITIGAGGAGGSRGSFSRINDLFAIGGGAHGPQNNQFAKTTSGGSAAGGGISSNVQSDETGGIAINAPVQGHNGGAGVFGNNSLMAAGGGGGAGAAGSNAVNNGNGGNGGAGLSSSITLTSTFRGGGGGGGRLTGTGSAGTGGIGGGGTSSNGAANTGGGGGGQTGQSTFVGRLGGSGVIIVRYSAGLPNLTVGAGLVIDNGSGGNVSGAGAALTPSFSDATWKIYMFKSGTGTVTL